MSSLSDDSKRYIGLLLLILTAFIGTAGFRISIPIIAYLIRESLGAAMTHVALMSTGYMLARALASVLFGAIIEKYGRVLAFITIGMALNSILLNLYPYMNNWIEVVILRTIQGFLGGMSWPLIQLVTALSSPKNIRGRVLSIYFALGSLGVFAGNAIYALIYDMPLTMSLLLSSVIYGSSILLVIAAIRILKFKYKSIRKANTARKFSESQSSSLTSSLAISVFIGGFAVTYGGAIVFGGVSYVYIHEVYQIPKPIVALILGATGIVGIIASIALGWIADRKSEKLALNMTLALMAMAIPLLLIKNTLLLIIALMFIAIAQKSYMPLSRRIMATHIEKSAIGIGGINAVMNIGMSVGQITFGAAYDLMKPLMLTVAAIQVITPPIILLASTPLTLASMILLSRQKRIT